MLLFCQYWLTLIIHFLRVVVVSYTDEYLQPAKGGWQTLWYCRKSFGNAIHKFTHSCFSIGTYVARDICFKEDNDTPSKICYY